MTRNAFVALMGLVVATAAPLAEKTNLSGTWTMVAAKSDFGQMPAPAKYEQRIEHADPNLKITITQAGQQGDNSNDFTYHTGGKQTSNDFRGGRLKSKAKWEGETLVITSTLSIQGNDVAIVERYTLDGGMLTMTRKMTTPNGDIDMRVVMAKQ